MSVIVCPCVCVCAEPPLMSPGTTINQAQSLINYYSSNVEVRATVVCRVWFRLGRV